MPSLWKSYWKVLFLSAEPFQALRGLKGALWFAVRFFMIVALVASIGQLASVSAVLEEPTLAERVSQLASRVAECAADLPDLLAAPIEGIAGRIEDFSDGITEVQAPLGPRASKIVRLVGEWLTTPFVLLGAWMGALLALWVVARLFGASGGLRDHLGLSLLAFAPQVLTFGVFIPIQVEFIDRTQWAFALIALLWSLVILTQAIAVAHQIDNLQAVKVIVVTLLVFWVLIPYLLLLLGGLIVMLLI